MDDDNLPVQCHPKIEIKKKQACGYCPEDKCRLDCEICNPKKGNKFSCDC
jgi:hypothetical protein